VNIEDVFCEGRYLGRYEKMEKKGKEVTKGKEEEDRIAFK
jgi:hypothetical protein